jgi:hypothetical protein
MSHHILLSRHTSFEGSGWFGDCTVHRFTLIYVNTIELFELLQLYCSFYISHQDKIKWEDIECQICVAKEIGVDAM